MLDFLLRGPLMDEAGGADGGGGALTADLGAGTDLSVDTGAPASEETALAVIDESDEPQDLEPFKALENGRLTQKASQALTPLKAASPQLYQQVQQALGSNARLRSMFKPGVNPFDEIKSLQRFQKEIGGTQGLQEIRDELAQMETLDLLYASANPQVFDQMTSAPEGARAFVKLFPSAVTKTASLPGGKAAIASMAPRMMEMFREFAPKAYTQLWASAILGHMVNADMDANFRRLASLIPKDDPVGGPAIAEIQKAFDDLRAWKQLQPETLDTVADPAKDPRDEELQQQRQQLAKEKKELELNGWKSAANADKNRIFERAWAAETKGKKISAVDREDIQARITSRIPMALGNIAGFQDSLKEHYEANDKDGYLRYLRSKHEEVIPRIVRAEVNRRLGTAGAATVKPVAGQSAVNSQVDAGFKRVAVKPPYQDMMKGVNGTTPDMFKKGQAILKNGQRVQWL